MMSRPRIVGFVCNWSLPTEIGAPITGRIAGYPKVRLVRVPCVGRIDPVIVLETLSKGADGVLIIGCNPPDCHYVEGNLQAERAVQILKKLLQLAGLESERLKLLWYTSSDKRSFGHQIGQFFKEIGNLGPLSLKNERPESELAMNVLVAKNVASSFRFRVLLGREKELTEAVNTYGEKIPPEEFDDLLDDIVETEFIRHKIHVLTKTTPSSVKALAEAVGVNPAIVLDHIVNLRRKNMIALDHVEGTTPFYKALVVE